MRKKNQKLVLLWSTMKIIKALKITIEIFRYEVDAAFFILLFDFLLLLHIINMTSAFEWMINNPIWSLKELAHNFYKSVLFSYLGLRMTIFSHPRYYQRTFIFYKGIDLSGNSHYSKCNLRYILLALLNLKNVATDIRNSVSCAVWKTEPT